MRTRRASRAKQYESATFREIQGALAASVRQGREALGLTQEEAAFRCGMATFVFQEIETGRSNATLTTLARLCDGLNVTMPTLFVPAARPNPRPRGRPKRGAPTKAKD